MSQNIPINTVHGIIYHSWRHGEVLPVFTCTDNFNTHISWRINRAIYMSKSVKDRVTLLVCFACCCFLEANYKALAWCSIGFQWNTSLLKMRVPTAISLSANWMQPLGSWRAAIKSSVRLNVSGPEKQRPINSTEPDVPKRMDLAKSLWKWVFFEMKNILKEKSS